MNRNPWRSRARLLALVDGIAGLATAGGALAVVLGVLGDISQVEAIIATGTAAAVDFVALLANYGVIADGESKTTPVDSPLGADLLPLVSIRDVGQLSEVDADHEA